jgi:hypothetical protein
MLFEVGNELASDLGCQTFSKEARKWGHPVWDDQHTICTPHESFTQEGRKVDWCSQGAAALCGSGES